MIRRSPNGVLLFRRFCGGSEASLDQPGHSLVAAADAMQAARCRRNRAPRQYQQPLRAPGFRVEFRDKAAERGADNTPPGLTRSKEMTHATG